MNNEIGIKKRISSQETGRGSESELAKAAYVARNVHQTSAEIKIEYLGAKAEDDALIKHARESGIWVEHPEVTYGKTPDASGVESWVFIEIDGSSVIKINSGIHYPNWLSFFFRVLAHNIYFPQTSYELIGFTLRNDQLAAILRQPLISILRSATPEEIEIDLKARGFRYNGINDALDEDYGVILRDMHQENVVIADNGNVSYIDPIIQFTATSRFLAEAWELF